MSSCYPHPLANPLARDPDSSCMPPSSLAPSQRALTTLPIPAHPKWRADDWAPPGRRLNGNTHLDGPLENSGGRRWARARCHDRLFLREEAFCLPLLIGVAHSDSVRIWEQCRDDGQTNRETQIGHCLLEGLVKLARSVAWVPKPDNWH